MNCQVARNLAIEAANRRITKFCYCHHLRNEDKVINVAQLASVTRRKSTRDACSVRRRDRDVYQRNRRYLVVGGVRNYETFRVGEPCARRVISVCWPSVAADVRSPCRRKSKSDGRGSVNERTDGR